MLRLSATVRKLDCRDGELAQAVFSAARSRCTRGGIRGLMVGALAGKITLDGRASSFYDKQLLLHAALQVPGVIEVIDRVAVQPATAS
ncbi:MAG: BON domain-containing protein [Pirellulaceae bacterium]|nr:BON domain-containing protein [Pirellulaceae bacterium]